MSSSRRPWLAVLSLLLLCWPSSMVSASTDLDTSTQTNSMRSRDQPTGKVWTRSLAEDGGAGQGPLDDTNNPSAPASPTPPSNTTAGVEDELAASPSPSPAANDTAASPAPPSNTTAGAEDELAASPSPSPAANDTAASPAPASPAPNTTAPSMASVSLALDLSNCSETNLSAGVFTCWKGLAITNTGALRLFNVTAAGDAGCVLPVLEPSTTAYCEAAKAVPQDDFEAGHTVVSVSVSATTSAAAAAPVQGSITQSVPLQAQPSAVVTIAAAEGAPLQVNAAGSLIPFIVSAINRGNLVLKHMTLASPELGQLSCPEGDGSLAPGQALVCTATYTTNATDLEAGQLTFTATGSSPTLPAVVEATQAAVVTMVPQPQLDLSILASSCNQTHSASSQSIGCLVSIQNSGNVRLGNIQTGLEGCAPPVLQPKEAVNCTVLRWLTPVDLDHPSATMSVPAASAKVFGASPKVVTSQSDKVDVPLLGRVALLDVDFSATPLRPSTAGDNVTFHLKAKNVGTLRLTSVALTTPAQLESSLLCSTTEGSPSQPSAELLEPGAAITCTATLQVTTADIQAGPQELTVSAAAASAMGPLRPVVASLSLQPQVLPQLRVVIDKAGCIVPSKADPEGAAGLLTCPITIQNAGNCELADVQLLTPPGSCSSGSSVLAVGAAPLLCNVSVTASQSDFEQGSMQLLVEAAARPNAVGAPATTCAKAAVAISLVEVYGVEVVPEVTPLVVDTPGTNLSLTYRITNTGNCKLSLLTLNAPGVPHLECGAAGMAAAGLELDAGDTVVCRGSYLITQELFDNNRAVAVSASLTADKLSGEASLIKPVMVTFVRRPDLSPTSGSPAPDPAPSSPGPAAGQDQLPPMSSPSPAANETDSSHAPPSNTTGAEEQQTGVSSPSPAANETVTSPAPASPAPNTHLPSPTASPSPSPSPLTPCDVCNECLDSANRLTEATRFLQDGPSVVAAFDKWCGQQPATWAPPDKCAAIKASITSSINTGKRAGLVCQSLGACNTNTLPATCKLASRKAAVGSAAVAVKGGQLDKCTLEGVSDGDLPPGVRPAGFKPLGTCCNTTDCSDGYDCTLTDKTICSCDAATGAESCRPLGGCTMQPCKACEVCVQAMQLFPDIVMVEVKPTAVADKFRSFCAGTGRSPPVCETTAAAIAASVAGNLGRRAGALCQSLAECPALASTCNVTLANSLQRLDYCTIKGAKVGATAAEVSGTAPAGSCQGNSNCSEDGTFCSMASQSRVCSCVSDTGVVACNMLGACQKTPCRVCSDCLAGWQPFIHNTTSENAAYVASAFSSTCSSRNNSDAICKATAGFISSSFKGNLGKRAGALCSMLGKCAGSVLTDATCRVQPSPSLSGGLDLCTREGINTTAGGRMELPGVVIGTGLPPGVCMSNKDCPADSKCNLKNSNTVCRCSGGFDTCRPPPPTGFCQLKPAPLPQLTRCETCQRCLNDFRNATSPASGTASEWAAAFRAACASKGRASADCDKAEKAIAGSYKGNLAKRVGGVCRVLGECDAGLATNSSCLLSVANNKRGTLSECLKEGVSTGTAVEGIGAQDGTCFSDANCPDAAKSKCSAELQVQVCTCRSGLDSCNLMSTCQAPPAPPAPPVKEVTPCEKCQACVQTMQGVVASTNQLSDRFTVGDTVFEACKQYWKDTPTATRDLGCSQLHKVIRNSQGGITGKRAGLVCSLMGECETAALGASCNITASNTTAGRLDLCSVEGVMNGTAVQGIKATAGLEAGQCGSDTDCTNGSICDQSNTTSACTCSAGVDTCKKLGTCVKFCDSPQAQRKLATASTQVVVCDPFLPNTCSGGLLCQPSSAGVQLVCKEGVGIVPVAVGGVCVPADRKLLSARFSADGKVLAITLNAAARTAEGSCGSLFATGSSAALGAKAWCVVADRTLSAQLDSYATVIPGQVMELRANQTVLLDKLQSDVAFRGSVKVQSCTECAAPIATVTGPQVVAEACDTSPAAATVFDASFCSDPSGRPLKSLEWGQDLAAGSNPVLAAVINEVNKGASVKARSLLSLPATSVAQLADGSYTLTVMVTNFLDQSAFAKLSFKKVGPGTAPVISIVGGPAQTFRIADGVNLPSALEPTSVCAGRTVTYTWESLDSWTGIPAGGYSLKNLVLPAPVPAEAGQTYNLRLTARFTGSPSAATADVALTAVGSPLSASLLGPSGDIMGDKDIVLDASRSLDPDDPKGTSPLLFTWDCVREDFPQPCFPGTNMGDVKGSRWRIPAGLLTGLEKVHTFTVVVTKGVGEAARTAQASLQVKPRDPAVPIPTGVLTRDCGGSCSARHAATQPLSVSLKLDRQAATASSGQVQIVWSLDPPGQQALVVPAAAAAADAIRNTQVQLVIPREALPNAAAVTISVKLSIPGQQGAGSASLTVPLNAPPEVSSPLEVQLLGADNTFGTAAFRLSAAGIVDDTELTYEYWKGSEFVQRSKSNTHTFRVGELPEGDTTLSVHAVNPEGADVWASVDVTVAPRPADFDVSSTIWNLDVQQAAGSNDPIVLAQAGSQLDTLTAMSQAEAQDSGAARRLLAAADAAAGGDSVTEAVRVKVMQLLGALRLSAAANLADTASMRQVSSAAYQLVELQQEGELTDLSLTDALSIASAAIASASLDTTTADSMYASVLLGLTARGLRLSGGTSSTAGAGRRHLLEAPAGYTLSPAAAASAATTAATLQSVASMLQPATGPGRGWVSATAVGLSVSVASELGATYSGLSMAVGPQVTSAGLLATQVASTQSLENAIVTLLGPLSPVDDAVPVFAEMVQDPAALITAVPSPSQADVAAYQQAAANSSVAPSLLGLTLLTSAVRLRLPNMADSDGALPCAEAACTAVLKLPVLNAAWVNTSRLLLCLRIVGGLPVAAASAGDGYSLQEAPSSSSYLQCATNKQGLYVVAAVDRVDVPSAAASPSQSGSALPGDSAGTVGNGSVASPMPSGNTTTNATNTTSGTPAVDASPSPSPTPAQDGGQLQVPAAALHGRLINLGAVTQCTGAYASGASYGTLATDGTGSFTVSAPLLARYAFAPTAASGSCVDSVLQAQLSFPYTVDLPPLANATVTAISLLAVPARADPSMQAKYGSMAKVVPQGLFTEVYRMFGYAASDKVDFLALSGLSGAQFAAVLGHSAQAMGTFTSVNNLLRGLLPEVSAASVEAQVVSAVYAIVVKSNSPTNASQSLTDAGKVYDMCDRAFTALLPLAAGSSGPTTRRRLQAAVALGSARAGVFAAVGKVVAGSNQQLQQLVMTAQTESSSSASQLLALRTSIAKLAAVQQQDMATSITTLAGAVRSKAAANDQDYDELTASLTEDYSEDNVAKLAGGKAVDAAATSALMVQLGVQDTAPATQQDRAWIAGPVVGGVAAAALLAGVAWWLYTQRRPAAIPAFNTAGTDAAARIQRVADAYAVPQDGSSPAAPREPNPTRAGASLSLQPEDGAARL